jgi:hypothetical protein
LNTRRKKEKKVKKKKEGNGMALPASTRKALHVFALCVVASIILSVVVGTAFATNPWTFMTSGVWSTASTLNLIGVLLNGVEALALVVALWTYLAAKSL